MRSIPRWLDWLLKAWFIILLLLLFCSLLAGYIDPRHFWAPAFIKLFFPVWLAGLGLFLGIFLWLRQWKWAMAGFGALLLSLPALFSFHSLGEPRENAQPAATHKLRLMTYNVMGFGWYEDYQEVTPILRNIRTVNPDVICMQEYLMRPDDKLHILDTLVNRYGYKYYREHVVAQMGLGYYFGLAVFSKTPLGKMEGIPFNSRTNGGCYVDVPWQGDTLRVVNLHFESFGIEENRFLNFKRNDDLSLLRKQILLLRLKQMRRAFRLKSYQTAQAKKIVETSPHPVILVGDFNDTPLSHAYKQLTGGRLEDSYKATSSGIGATYAGRLPWLRIDYLLADTALHLRKTEVLKVQGSDHYPLVGEM